MNRGDLVFALLCSNVALVCMVVVLEHGNITSRLLLIAQKFAGCYQISTSAIASVCTTYCTAGTIVDEFVAIGRKGRIGIVEGSTDGIGDSACQTVTF
jgi:hypothetical protein